MTRTDYVLIVENWILKLLTVIDNFIILKLSLLEFY